MVLELKALVWVSVVFYNAHHLHRRKKTDILEEDPSLSYVLSFMVNLIVVGRSTKRSCSGVGRHYKILHEDEDTSQAVMLPKNVSCLPRLLFV